MFSRIIQRFYIFLFQKYFFLELYLPNSFESFSLKSIRKNNFSSKYADILQKSTIFAASTG